MDWELTEILLRGVAISAMAVVALAFVRSNAGMSVRVAGLLFSLSVIAYVVNSSPTLRQCPTIIGVPLTFLSLGGGGYFWLFVYTLFEDKQLKPVLFAPAAVLTVVGLGAIVVGPPRNGGLWIVHNLIEMALSAHVLLIVYRSWRDDLVEARRRLRGPFLVAVTLFVITLSGFEIGESLGLQSSWYSLAGAVALAVFCFAGAATFLEPRDALFGAATRENNTGAAGPPRLEPADRLAVEKLNTLMETGQVWRREGLAIGTLAEEIGVPEHRLRRLINDHLGHRNFAAFVNARRIETAKGILSDPAQSRTTVAAIAFDLGFGSLGPFNRAFKEATGVTPTQWRRKVLENDAPNSQNPD